MVATPFHKATMGPVWFTEVRSFHHRWRTTNDSATDAITAPNNDHYWRDIDPSTSRQARDIRYLTTDLLRFRGTSDHGGSDRITHLFYYQWADRNEAFGAGLIDTPDGSGNTRRRHPISSATLRAAEVTPAERSRQLSE